MDIIKVATEKKHADYYQLIRKRIRNWLKSKKGSRNTMAEYLMIAPDIFHLLCKLSADPDIPSAQKKKLMAAIGYFISPVDIIPELILGPIGLIDDIVIAVYILNEAMNKTSHEIIKRHWAGEEDILLVLQRIMKVGDTFFGATILKKIKKMVGK